ncbi:hypothetical protein EGW08_012049 [Elysia chlorotica]|uniref:Uncharacterized protein n=1 Tax=Elysia chlorotica TaxID=188477 RepID=A0A3S0ZKZ6_ELYCH|nr:hypothetical protein EGW08_012049 [Elysia chlorotica]
MDGCLTSSRRDDGGGCLQLSRPSSAGKSCELSNRELGDSSHSPLANQLALSLKMDSFRSLLAFLVLSTLLLSDTCFGATTPVPAVTDSTTVSPVSASASAAIITTASIIDESTAQTTQGSVTSNINDVSTDATQAATTPPAGLGPDQTNGNTQPDPLGGASTTAPTVSVVVTTESSAITTTTPQTISSTATPPQQVEDNPYSNLPRRPWQLKPSNPGQGQQQPGQNPLPWLFYGRDFFPFLYLLSNGQQQQNSGQTGNRNMAPLYAYGMDMDIWPWSFFFNQNSGQQQNQQQNQFGWQNNQQQNDFGWPQNQQQSNLGWSQNQRQVNTNQRNNGNSLANWFWLGEF